MKRSQNHLVGRESLVFIEFNTCAYAGVPATKVGGQAMCSWVLTVFTDERCTSSLSNCWTTLAVKKSFLVFRWNFTCFVYVSSCPVTVHYWEGSSSIFTSLVSGIHTYLYKYPWAFCSLGWSLSSLCLFSYEKWTTLFNHLFGPTLDSFLFPLNFSSSFKVIVVGHCLSEK